MTEDPRDPEELDRVKQDMGFGDGGVPWLLLLGYLTFLAFFTWYTTTHQLTDFEKNGPFASAEESVEEE